MAKLQLPPDFKEFLRLLNSNRVEYLLIGGYAVNIHGYVRLTNDMDIWVRATPPNAILVANTLRAFGFAEVDEDLFIQPNTVVRMGVPPMRLEILTSPSGVDFEACYGERLSCEVDGIAVPVISLARLRENKAAAGRLKDLADLENLPEDA